MQDMSQHDHMHVLEVGTLHKRSGITLGDNPAVALLLESAVIKKSNYYNYIKAHIY